MNALILCLIASMCTSFASYLFRKNSDSSASTSCGYLVLFYFFSFLVSLFYEGIWTIKINYVVLGIGISVGLLNSILMSLTSKAFKQGPAGLTYAFQNASAVFPGLILFLVLGSDYGFSWTFLQLTGMLLVLCGLFIGAKNESANQTKASVKWLKFALACFFIQILALTCIQGRCILFSFNETSSFLSNFAFTEAEDVWFMPGQFGASFITQVIIFLQEKRQFEKTEVIYGFFGGLANFSSTSLLLLATKVALPFEKGILFPCFAVGSMIICNIWAYWMYKEDFNLKTNALCSLGIFMAVAA